MSSPPGEDPRQLSLLSGFPPQRRRAGAVVPSAHEPVAAVILDSPVPHLDRVFDYLVPEAVSDDAQPGVRVKVGFAGRSMSGFIVERRAESTVGGTLRPLTKVVSPQPVAFPVLPLARMIAERYAGSLSDVLRAAVPPRVARVDKEFPTAAVAEQMKEHEVVAATSTQSLFATYTGGEQFIAHLAAGEAPRAVLTTLRGHGPENWAAEFAEAVATTVLAGKGAVVVVPDSRDLVVMEAALQERIGPDSFVRLSAEDGPTPRYRNFLRLLHGQVRVAIGTRSAAYAPVRNLGLVCLWDDGDTLHSEPRAPYQHVRDVLLLRAEHEGSAALLSSFHRSTEAQRLTETGWARSLQAPRPVVRSRTPRVVHTTDSFHSAVDPLASRARIPHAAWTVAKAGLELGPVLIQVARAGFVAAVACEACRVAARCRRCTGPLALSARGEALSCRWCGLSERSFRCQHCGAPGVRATSLGAGRTAEDLGRAFPSVPVVSSSGDHVVGVVPDEPAIVVATPGAEPGSPRGYAAALLLDGDVMMSRESLRASEEARRRWFNAAALVRSASAGGAVAITAGESMSVAALVRWDPAGAAARELEERREIGLPPAVRSAALTGSPESLALFMDGIQLAQTVRVAGSVAIGDSRWPNTSRLLLFFSYSDAATVVRQLRARKLAQSAKHTVEPVHVRCDPVDGL